MNTIRKYLGIIWIILGVYFGYFSITSVGLPKFQSGLAGNTSDLVFGIIMLLLLTPIIVGSLLTFGYFALNGDYDQ
ncbi:MAG: hypothetical protein IPO92_23895 [Saprospiraceae bacterium]|nr:hypothetical protein [Saprospiraceae bacterium]